MSAIEFKLCNRCEQEKPFTDFYTKRNGNPFSECKACLKQRGKDKPPTPRLTTLIKSEQRVIDLLNSMGIPSITGKAVSHAYADIVSWGCVLIETKTSRLEGIRGAMFKWAFSEPQKQDGLRADLIILECEWGAGNYSYHLFKATDGIFYRDGALKGAVTYTVERRNSGNQNSVLTKAIMEAHKNRWDMIATKRLEIEQQLRNGQSWLVHDRKKGA